MPRVSMSPPTAGTRRHHQALVLKPRLLGDLEPSRRSAESSLLLTRPAAGPPLPRARVRAMMGHRRADQEGAMCRLSSSEYDLYRRTSAKPGRSLLGWLRDLWRPRPPRVEEAEVVPFAPETAARVDREADRGRPRAA